MVLLGIGAGIQAVEYQRLNPPKCQRAFVKNVMLAHRGLPVGFHSANPSA